jgi:hypothetical protein
MGSLPRTAPQLIAATIILLGCAPGPGSAPSRSAPSAALPSAWAADPCVVADTSAPTADTLFAIGVVVSSTAFECSAVRVPSDATPPVVVSLPVPAGVDLRELLDGAMLSAGGHRPDVIVTRDADVLAYAAGPAGYLIAALPWSATYLLIPARASASITLPPPAERDALARDAVATDARGAAEPFPWLTDSACAAIAAVPIADPRPVVAYAAGDATARQLAERIVSLAGASAEAPWVAAALGRNAPGGKMRIAALPADSIPKALATGGAAAAVLPIARDPRTVCATAGNARVPAGAVPLVDARAHVIVRRGSGAAFTIGADGSLHFFRQSAR